MCVAFPARSGVLAYTNLLAILERNGIAVDPAAAERGAADGVLAVVDPGARILDGDDHGTPAAAESSLDAARSWTGNGIQYIRVRGLYTGGETQLTERVRAALAEKQHGILLDLRGAGGGNLDAVDRIASLFAEPGQLLYEVRDGSGAIVRTGTAAETPRVDPAPPMMLLVDGQTRQCSEVLAAVLRACPGIMTVGARTRGETALREALPLGDGRTLLIATRWVVPGGTAPLTQGEGMAPDIEVAGAAETAADAPEPEADTEPYRDHPLSDKTQRDRALLERVAGDPVLERATDILLGLIALDARADMKDTAAYDGDIAPDTEGGAGQPE
jgi:C-terminal processing protease CtpA/Prc